MKSPAFQFYPADYLADAKVQALSIEGEGCYFRLLCYCWREGFIPSNRVAIARLCKGYDGPGIDEAISMFSRGEKRGQLVHRRLDKERKRQAEHSKLMQESGLRGAMKRWKIDSQAIQRPMASDSSSSSSSSTNKKEPPNPLKRGRKYQSKHLGANEDPVYKDAYERRKKAESEGREPLSNSSSSGYWLTRYSSASGRGSRKG